MWWLIYTTNAIEGLITSCARWPKLNPCFPPMTVCWKCYIWLWWIHEEVNRAVAGLEYSPHSDSYLFRRAHVRVTPFLIDVSEISIISLLLTFRLAGIMLLTKRQLVLPSAIHDEFRSICTTNDLYIELGIAPFLLFHDLIAKRDFLVIWISLEGIFAAFCYGCHHRGSVKNLMAFDEF